MTLKEALFTYADRFHENFPTVGTVMTESELIATIEECLKKGEPYKFEWDDMKGLI